LQHQCPTSWFKNHHRLKKNASLPLFPKGQPHGHRTQHAGIHTSLFQLTTYPHVDSLNTRDVSLPLNSASRLQKLLSQSQCLWNIINQSQLNSIPSSSVHDPFLLAHIIEDNIQYLVNHCGLLPRYHSEQPLQQSAIARLLAFYSQPELIIHCSCTSSTSLTNQILFPKKPPLVHLKPKNFFDLLFEDFDDDMSTMDIDNLNPPTNSNSNIMPSPNIVIPSWNTDASITALSENLFSHMEDRKKFTDEMGKTEEISPDYQKPIPIIEAKGNQRIRFNLIRHRGAVADIPILKLFKSFTSTLKKANSSVIILPFQASKQHYLLLSTLKHIQAVNDNKISQFFKSYHQKQLYSLSGYFHIFLGFLLKSYANI
jgi:hypothetical protein